MLEAILEILGELLLQLIGQALLELGLHALAAPFKRTPNPWLAAVGYLLFGFILGGISLWPFPSYLVPAGGWRIANLATTPVLVGATMVAIGAWRARRGDEVMRIDRFVYGYLLAFGIALVRFHFAH